MESNIGFQNWKKNQKLPNFYNFENHPSSTNSQNDQIFEIVEFQELLNYQNLTICITIKTSKISNLMVIGLFDGNNVFWVSE